MLTEREVTRTWQKLFRSRSFTDDTFVRAEALIDELRPESPLRHRLITELAELKRLKDKQTAKASS